MSKIVVMLLVAVMTMSLMPAASAQSTWEHAATHPQASTQSSDYGKIIKTLHEWNGLLYPGYGDYGNNTGPVHITPFDPNTDSFRSTVHTADTEQIHLFREIGGYLAVPHIDTRSGADWSLATSATSWANKGGVSSLHVFDIIKADSAIWMVGSAGRNAVVWRSTDGGASWSVSLSVPPKQSDDYARFYFSGYHNGNVYVQAYDLYKTPKAHPTSKVWNGSAWVDGPDLQVVGGYGQSPRTFNGEMVYQGWHPGWCQGLAAFNGSSARRLRYPDGAMSHVNVYDFVIDGDYLYAINCSGEVIRTSDLSNWTTVTPALSTARSLAVVGVVAYVGTSDGQIHRTTITDPNVGPEPPPRRVCVLIICW